MGLQREPEVLALAFCGLRRQWVHVFVTIILAVSTLPSARCRTCRGSSAPTLTNQALFQVLESSSPVTHSGPAEQSAVGLEGLGPGGSQHRRCLCYGGTVH